MERSDKEMYNNPLLEIKNLEVQFSTRKGFVTAVDKVTMAINAGEITGVVGESGSGKSVMSQSILRLNEYDSTIKYKGEIIFGSKNLLELPLSQMRNIRGNLISIIFQDALSSLSPVHSIGKQLIEVLKLHKKMSKKTAKQRSLELLALTGIQSPEDCLKKYPHELSGGMQQRVMIAMALSCEPSLLIADEPTTALDMTIQKQILELIAELNEKLKMSVLFISHDLSAVSQLCHSVRVMYLGNIVEEGRTEELFKNPLHPYTQGLLNCTPRLDLERGKPLNTIQGVVPTLANIPKGCHFCTRCDEAYEICYNEKPLTIEVHKGHSVKCWKYVPMGEGEIL